MGRSSVYALLSPTTYVPDDDTGLFRHFLPDVSIAQLMFFVGLTLVVLAALGLPRAAAAGPRLRRAAAVIAMAGLAAAGTAVGLTSAGRTQAYGIVIPALHDAANDRPIAYTPVCGQAAGVTVCVHPAYRNFLPDMTAALAPVLRQIASLTGAPARVDQVAVNDLIASNGAAITGVPPVFRLPVPAAPDETSFGQNLARSGALCSPPWSPSSWSARRFRFHGSPGRLPGAAGRRTRPAPEGGHGHSDGRRTGKRAREGGAGRGGGQEVRRAAGCQPARLAGCTPGRAAAGRITLAQLPARRRPEKPEPRAEAPRSRGLLGHPGLRLVRLHLASRRVPAPWPRWRSARSSCGPR